MDLDVEVLAREGVLEELAYVAEVDQAPEVHEPEKARQQEDVMPSHGSRLPQLRYVPARFST
jgi:hypothetical protein